MSEVVKAWLLDAIKTVGFPIVAFFCVAYVFNNSLEFERDQMMPLIQKCANSFETNTRVLEAAASLLKDIQKTQLKTATVIQQVSDKQDNKE